MDICRHLLATASIALLYGCAQTAPPVAVASNWLGEDNIGTINGENVPESLFRTLGLNMLQKPAESMTDEERANVIEQLVTLQLVAKDAERQELDQERTVAAELELNRLQRLGQAAVERYVEENPPSEAEIRALYDERMETLSGTEFKASHILLETEAEAVSIIEQLNSGSDFATLAQEFSTGPTGSAGGDLGWFTPDRMVEPFANAVRDMEVGSYSSDPVQTQFGWHVIWVAESRDQQPPGIESMRQELTAIAQRQKVDDYLSGLRDRAEIAVE